MNLTEFEKYLIRMRDFALAERAKYSNEDQIYWSGSASAWQCAIEGLQFFKTSEESNVQTDRN